MTRRPTREVCSRSASSPGTSMFPRLSDRSTVLRRHGPRHPTSWQINDDWRRRSAAYPYGQSMAVPLPSERYVFGACVVDYGVNTLGKNLAVYYPLRNRGLQPVSSALSAPPSSWRTVSSPRTGRDRRPYQVSFPLRGSASVQSFSIANIFLFSASPR